MFFLKQGLIDKGRVSVRRSMKLAAVQVGGRADGKWKDCIGINQIECLSTESDEYTVLTVLCTDEYSEYSEYCK